jgi:divalent metal cation (Fe/Co/Zn/Cd) transporter
LAAYLSVQMMIVFAAGYHPGHSPLGVVWTAITALIMFTLAAGTHRAGHPLTGVTNSPALITESRGTVIDGLLVVAVCSRWHLTPSFGWWWADPAAGLVIVYYALKEAHAIHAELRLR